MARHYRVTWSDALHQHDEALKDGGRRGILNEHALRSALGRPYHGYHRRIHRKAAALLHGIVTNHGFVDGNKRTALYVVELLLRRSGYRLDADDRTVVDLVLAVADGTVTHDALVDWFKRHVRRIRRPTSETTSAEAATAPPPTPSKS